MIILILTKTLSRARTQHIKWTSSPASVQSQILEATSRFFDINTCFNALIGETRKRSGKLLPLDQFLFMDTLWLSSTLFTKQPSNWKGFMSQVMNGHFECTKVFFNQMNLCIAQCFS